jgi:ubiquinone biosynthesis protein UbiJ
MSLIGILALSPLELVLNKLIAHDPHTAQRVEAFDGKCIEVVIDFGTRAPESSKSVLSADLPSGGALGSASVCAVFRGQTIKLNLASSSALMQTPDAVLRGSASALIDLLLQPAQRRALSNPALTLSGDADLIQALYHFTSSLDLRWGDYLAPFIGNVASNEIERVCKEANEWGQETRTALTDTVDDYLVEEAKLVPTRFEVHELRDGIDALRLRIDRLEARIRSAEGS